MAIYNNECQKLRELSLYLARIGLFYSYPFGPSIRPRQKPVEEKWDDPKVLRRDYIREREKLEAEGLI